MTDEQRAREIDALVAEHVMGWEITHRGRRVRPGHDYGHNHREVTGFTGYTDARRWIATVCHEFSTTWEGMGLVVKKMREEGWFWTFGNWTVDRSGPCWYAWIEQIGEDGEHGAVYDTSADTLPMAVCRVALYARSVDVAALTETPMSDVDRALGAARRLNPDLYEKVDAIAEIIEPGVFAEWWDGSGPEAKKRRPTVRQRYMQSDARSRAYRILQYLGIAPETTDWLAIFAEMERTP